MSGICRVGKLFILSAPSGAGKTTILKKVMADLPGLAFSVSHTTRPPRPGEEDGADYHFVSRQQFEIMREEGHFWEWAEVHGNLYGTSRTAVLAQLASGLDVILDIDVQGAAMLRQCGDVQAASFLFIAPPSLHALEQRLRGRQTESEESIVLRLHNAKNEMLTVAFYDYLIVNDALEQAIDTLRAIIIAERSRGHRLPTGQPINILDF